MAEDFMPNTIAFGNVEIFPTTITSPKKRILKNVFVTSIAVTLFYTSFDGLVNLQSTLNKDGGLGTTGLAIVYGSQIVSCLFLPSLAVAYLGCKWTLATSMLCFVLYTAANMYPVPYSIYPTSVIVGLGSATMMSAEGSYITEIAVRYAELTNQEEDAVINLFFGIVFMFGNTAGIWGNVISSTVLETHPTNFTSNELSTCGPTFCPANQSNNTNLDKPDMEKIYAMLGCYIACVVLAFLIVAFFLDNITFTEHAESQSADAKKQKLSSHLIIDTARHCWTSTSQKLLIPLTMYSGVEQAFIAGDFTKSYISCSAGVGNVGYVMICFGVVTSICSLLFGRFAQYVGQVFFFVFGALVHLSVHAWLLVWTPSPGTLFVLYVLAGLLGICDTVWDIHIYALYGQLFTSNKEAAFANYFLWESLGFTITFAYSDALCTDAKIYLCIGLLVIGMAGYGYVEFMEKRKNRPHEMIESETKPWIIEKL